MNFSLLGEEEVSRIGDLMRDATRSKSRVIQNCVEGLLSAPGKMLRPGLVVLSAKAVLTTRSLDFSDNGTARYARPVRQADMAGEAEEKLWPEIYRLAAAVELLHTATLVHDDVIDHAEMRRSRPTIFAEHGARTAILVGDHLVVAAFQLVSSLADKSSIELLSRTLRTITEGEILQMEAMDPAKPRFRPYFHQIIGKTAALFAASCRIGAQHAGGNSRQNQSLQRAGYNLGMAFQIVDDILDFDESPAESGKSPGRDLELGLITLPVICALKAEQGNEDSFAGKSLRSLLSGNAEAKYAIHERVERLGGFQKAREWAAVYSRRAARELFSIKTSDARNTLIALVDTLEKRSA